MRTGGRGPSCDGGRRWAGVNERGRNHGVHATIHRLHDLPASAHLRPTRLCTVTVHLYTTGRLLASEPPLSVSLAPWCPCRCPSQQPPGPSIWRSNDRGNISMGVSDSRTTSATSANSTRPQAAGEFSSSPGEGRGSRPDLAALYGPVPSRRRPNGLPWALRYCCWRMLNK